MTEEIVFLGTVTGRLRDPVKGNLGTPAVFDLFAFPSILGLVERLPAVLRGTVQAG